MKQNLMRMAGLAMTVVFGASLTAHGVEVITVRSGQVGGLPGLAGQPDDIVTFLPSNPPGAAISATPFTALDFAGASGGPAARVINPYTPFWTPGISDPAARWINFDGTFANADGTAGSGYGLPGSCLYAVPFTITTVGITSATISLEFAVDDYLGDQLFGGGNPAGLYINGISTGYDGGNYGAPTTHFQAITPMVSTGLNYIYLYQRDAGVTVSGLIFSARIEVIPAPGSLALAGLGVLTALRRRR